MTARWLRPVLLGGVAAAAAAALAVSLLPGSTARQPRPAQRTSAPATLTAAFVLNRAAAAAAAASRPVPRPGQFIYVSDRSRPAAHLDLPAPRRPELTR